MTKSYFTSESVTEGHSNKVCDQIADSIVDEYLKQDRDSRVACEVTEDMDQIHIMGEICSRGIVDYEKVVQQVLRRIGYDDLISRIDAKNYAIKTDIHKESPDISKESISEDSRMIGAGDQGIMYGYACKETPDYMPLAIELAHRLSKRLAYVRKKGVISDLLPDGKTQVTVEYRDGVPARVENIVISAQYNADAKLKDIQRTIKENVIKHAIPKQLLDSKTKILVNLCGRFEIGGPFSNFGLSGRELISDTYGGYAHHGGGSFSGKDPSKMDRSAAYMARYLAKNIVAAGYADKCEVQLSYAIGIPQPISIHVDTFGTSRSSEEYLVKMIENRENLTPAGIIKTFDLKRPIYAPLSSYGHFGANAESMPWEKITWR